MQLVDKLMTQHKETSIGGPKKRMFQEFKKGDLQNQQQQNSPNDNKQQMSTQTQEKVKTIEHYSYFLNDTIGKGFSSVVYKGRNKINSRHVAIKVIDLHKLSQSTMRQLLQSQIAIIKSLRHPHVLNCENVYVTVNNCYIVTQLCLGGDLATEIKKKGRLRGVDALKTMIEIAKGVQYLSTQNIIHRDIKPANILIHEGVLKIADFGFAKIDDHQGKKEKYSVGSPLYMSPQALFSNIYTKQSDIWSLGIVFYEILQGRPPWEPKNQKQLKQILKENKEIFFRIAVRDQIQNIIRGCLRMQRTERVSLQKIISALDQLMKEMLSQNNTAYRETLTKRNLNTLSCKDLNHINQSQNISTNIPLRAVIPKIPKPMVKEIPYLKQAAKKQERVSTGLTTVIGRNKSSIELKQRMQDRQLPLQQASRHNHRIVKAVINYSRFLYKSYSKIEKLETKDAVKVQIQNSLIDCLSYSINWLRDSVTIAECAQKFGVINFDKFKQTRCYTKTILVINQYYDRYIKFIAKTKKLLLEKKMNLLSFDSLPLMVQKLKNCLKDVSVSHSRNQHNIAVDIVVSIVILSDMLQKNTTSYFAEHSKIEETVETEPAPIINEEDINQLSEKLCLVVNQT